MRVPNLHPIILYLPLYAYRSPYSNYYAKIMWWDGVQLLYVGFVNLALIIQFFRMDKHF